LRSSGTTFSKRQRERDKQDRKRAKADRRAERKVERSQKSDSPDEGVDPDIAHIVPGPQPIPDDDT
jgi:hypothetical protein